MDADKTLPARKGVLDFGIDLLNALIRHSVAPDRDAIAVHHEKAARAAMSAVLGIGESEIKGEMIAGVRIERGRLYKVKAFR